MDIIFHSTESEFTRAFENELKIEGHFVRVVMSPLGIQDEIGREKPDVIIFDQSVAETKLFSAIKERLESHKPDILLIAYGPPWTGKEPHGGDCYLQAPFTPKELITAIKSRH